MAEELRLQTIETCQKNHAQNEARMEGMEKSLADISAMIQKLAQDKGKQHMYPNDRASSVSRGVLAGDLRPLDEAVFNSPPPQPNTTISIPQYYSHSSQSQLHSSTYPCYQPYCHRAATHR